MTTTAVLATGCAAGRPWPAHPVALSDRAFATQGQVTTIDVLPLDLEVWTEPGYEIGVADLRAAAEASLMPVALDELAKHNYAVGALIDWNGDYPGGNALAKDDLVATVSSLARYGASATAHPGQLPVPFLPARLGATTGADATLYVGGWAYVAEDRDTTGDQVAQGIAIGLIVLTVVAIVALIIGDSKSSGGHGHGHDHGQAHSGGSGHASGAGHVASVPGGHTGQVGGAHGAGSAGSGSLHSIGSFHHTGSVHPAGSFHHAARATADLVDAFGRTAAAIEINSAAPDWDDDPALPRTGTDPQMYLEMTLVDNHTGLVLWHAHQLFPADAASESSTTRAARTMLSLLPSRTGGLRAASN